MRGLVGNRAFWERGIYYDTDTHYDVMDIALWGRACREVGR